MTAEQVRTMDDGLLYPKTEIDYEIERRQWGEGPEAQAAQDALVSAGILEAVDE